MTLQFIDYLWWGASAALTLICIYAMRNRKMEFVWLETYLWYNLFRYAVLFGVYHASQDEMTCFQWYAGLKIAEQFLRFTICLQISYRVIVKNRDMVTVYGSSALFILLAVILGDGFWSKLQAASLVCGFMLFMSWLLVDNIKEYLGRMIVAVGVYVTAQAALSFWPHAASKGYPAIGVACMALYWWAIRGYGRSLTR